MIRTQAHQIVNQATINQSITRNTARHTQPPVGPVTPLTYISRDAQRHLANLNAGPLALRVSLYHKHYSALTLGAPASFNFIKTQGEFVWETV